FLIILFFFYHSPNTYIYTLSLHDALPISENESLGSFLTHLSNYSFLQPLLISINQILTETYIYLNSNEPKLKDYQILNSNQFPKDRKSTRLNSSHVAISYAVFCLKKKKKK